jgi:hypothetical protein
MRRVGLFLATAVLVPVGLVGVASPAHALLDQTCVVNEVITWSPPISDTPQSVTFTVHGQLIDCTSSSASTGSYFETGTASSATCTSLLGSGSGTRVFNWTNTAIAPSTFAYNRTTTRVENNLQVVAVGSIVAGTFTPAPAKSVGTAPQPDPTACATTGVAQQTAVGLLTIGL